MDGWKGAILKLHAQPFELLRELRNLEEVEDELAVRAEDTSCGEEEDEVISDIAERSCDGAPYGFHGKAYIVKTLGFFFILWIFAERRKINVDKQLFFIQMLGLKAFRFFWGRTILSSSLFKVSYG